MRLIIFSLIIGSNHFMYSEEKMVPIHSDVLLIMHQLWADSGFGKDPNRTERAAWIVKDSNEGFCLIRWPRSAESNREFWYEPIPRNTIAQIHTHADRVDPRPAKKDVALSRKIGIPIYTLSSSGIWMATPNGTIRRLSGAGWYKSVGKK